MFLTRNLAYIILYYNIYYTYIIIIKSGVVKKVDSMKVQLKSTLILIKIYD